MAPRRELIVRAEAAGSRLDAWLADALGSESRAAAQRLIDEGRALVNGRPQSKSHRVSEGERVTIRPPQPEAGPAPIAAEPRIASEDEHLLVVDKPPGVVVHPAPGHRAVTLVEWLEQRAQGAWVPHVVHRLDRDTSGLLLVAKSEAVQRRLRELLRQGRIEREYLALVRGRPGSMEGTIEAPLGRDVRRRTRMSTSTNKPRDARTHFAVERFIGPYTLLRARLETGRTHQIRAHLAAIGTPVCGDPEYGGAGMLGLRRQFLHSARLAFPHPAGDVPVEHRSPLPADLQAALQAAELEAPSK